jgi:hypothetical protein
MIKDEIISHCPLFFQPKKLFSVTGLFSSFSLVDSEKTILKFVSVEFVPLSSDKKVQKYVGI